MIYEITLDRLNEFAADLTAKQKRDLLFVRLYANAQCFLDKKLCSLYEVSHNSKVCGVFCIYSTAVTAFFKRKPNYDEFLSFLELNSSANFLEIDAKIGAKLLKKSAKRAVFGSFFTLKKSKNQPNSNFELTFCDDVKGFFDVLKNSSKAYYDTSFESYYCDYFYRKPFSCALYSAKSGGRIISTLALLHIYESTAIISDVATLPAYRNRGAASALINYVSGILLKKGLTPALLCTEKGAARLYEKLGFKKGKSFSLIMIKEEK